MDRHIFRALLCGGIRQFQHRFHPGRAAGDKCDRHLRQIFFPFRLKDRDQRFWGSHNDALKQRSQRPDTVKKDRQSIQFLQKFVPFAKTGR